MLALSTAQRPQEVLGIIPPHDRTDPANRAARGALGRWTGAEKPRPREGILPSLKPGVHCPRGSPRMATPPDAGFRRELGLLDAVVIVAGGIIGVGIFANPSNVARVLHSPLLILLAWTIGGGVALLGGFIWAELGSRLPHVGGQYIYLVAHVPADRRLSVRRGVALHHQRRVARRGGHPVRHLRRSLVRAARPHGGQGRRGDGAHHPHAGEHRRGACRQAHEQHADGGEGGRNRGAAGARLHSRHRAGKRGRLRGRGDAERSVVPTAPHGARADPVRVRRLAELRFAGGGNQGARTQPRARECHRRDRGDHACTSR